jgi:FMN phosphatase YigB (HAD superfamily)
VQAVLFDLDGTLLDLDLDAFLARYFTALVHALAPLGDASGKPDGMLEALHRSTRAMMGEHPGLTNREVFHAEFATLTGIDLDRQWSVFDRFYGEVFPTLADTAGPVAGGREVVETALHLGYRVAIATNPIFPRAAVEHRLAWAGLAGVEVALVTTYEDMTACKPHPNYYRQVSRMLGVAPSACLMVGDDHILDMAAADVGMSTYYVGSRAGVPAHMSGDLIELADLLPRLSDQGALG